jgi:probable phosphoglycerate mutase
MDSDLIVKQMTGVNKVKHPNMRPLALEAQGICKGIRDAGGSVDFEWVPRERNKAADALSNDAMDGKSVRRVHGGPDDVAEPEPTSRQDLRLLLVQVPSGEDMIERVAAAARPLVGPGARVVTAPDPVAVQTGRAIARAAGVEAETSTDWTADPGRAGSEPVDGASSAAYGRMRETGGTVVVVTTRRGIVTVLAEVLGLAPDRFWSLATAPGSLTGVEVWADGTASVAFTNRTDHLA